MNNVQLKYCKRIFNYLFIYSNGFKMFSANNIFILLKGKKNLEQ